MNDVKPIEADTAFIWLHAVRGRTAQQVTDLIDYGLAVHKHRYGPAARFEIASAKLTKAHESAIIDHAAKLGLPFDGFNDLATARLRRAVYPPLPDTRSPRRPQ